MSLVHRLNLRLYGGLAGLATGSTLLASPIIPGLHQKHELSEIQQGQILINELRCGSCHDGMPGDSPPQAPVLNQLGTRLRPDFLKGFIADPSKHDPGTTMPSLLGGLADSEAEDTADALTAYLLSLSTEGFTFPSEKAVDTARGKELYHEAGCIACHSPRDDQGKELKREGDVGLGHLAVKYQPEGLTAFLYQPRKVRPDGRMPDMNLTQDEAAALSAYLLGTSRTSDQSSGKAKPSPDLVAKGEAAFKSLNCSSCHQTDPGAPPSAAPASKVPQKGQLDLTKGCLSESPGNAPDYGLSNSQRAAIRLALAPNAQVEESPSERIQVRLTQLNCIACHQRDDYGGVLEERDAYFHSTEEALGNEARIPPSLTLTGAKLKPEWINKVLYEGERVRPYMKTRMPQYGDPALDGLTTLFDEADQLPDFEFKEPSRDENRTFRDGAHMLLGNKGLNCIACHNYNGKESPGMKGLDLMTSYQRLQPAWFNQFMRNPAKMRPGIIMPGFWPDGKAIQTEILNGDTETQLAALWYNFSLGRSARDPSGLKNEPSKLEVTDTPRTYRGRSQVAGYRGIAVGFPNGLNYAFNAQTGSFSAVWTGDFVTVGWQGQGPGNFNPAGKLTQLPQDVAILAEPASPWPLHPVRTKEHPVNPDPLYPRQHGYAFEGYWLDGDQVPTFRYRSGDVSIEDVTRTLSDNNSTLRRTISLQTEKSTDRYLRLAAGPVRQVAGDVYQVGDLKIMPDKPDDVLLRKSLDGEQELILHLKLAEGTTTRTINYLISR